MVKMTNLLIHAELKIGSTQAAEILNMGPGYSALQHCLYKVSVILLIEVGVLYWSCNSNNNIQK